MTVLLFSSATTAFSVESPRPEVAEVVKTWEGEEGLKVWTLRFGKPEEKKALVQITRVDHPWNKKIQVMDVNNEGKRRDYSVSVDGKKFVALVINGRNYGELYLPGERDAYRIYYSESLSGQGDAQQFLTDYLEQGNPQQD